MGYVDSILGTICYTIVVFGAGALTGPAMYSWLKKMMPWSS